MRLHYMRLHGARPRCPTTTCARSRCCWWRPRARGPTTSRSALIDELGEERGNELRRRYGDAFPAAYRADWVARSARRGHRADRGALARRRPGAQPLPAARGRRGRAAGEAVPLGRAARAVGHAAGVREHGREGRRRAALRGDARATASRSGSTTSASPTPGDGELEAEQVREAFQDAFVRAWRGDVEDDGYNRLLLRAAPDLARDHRAARDRRSTCARRGTTFSDTLRRAARWSPTRSIARLLVELFQRALRSRRARTASDAERGRRRRSSEAIDAVESLDQDRILRNFLAVIQAMLRTNYFQPATSGEPKLYLSFKLDPSELPMAAAAAPAVRDLRLLAAHRGRAPARRQGRARRHPLVGPARGLPHRGARPDEGADGEERGDRAGRREGRVRGQAAARRRRRASSWPRSRRCYRDVHPRAARPDRQHRRRRDRAAAATSCATTTTTRTSWSPPTAAPRRFSDIANGIAREYGFWLGDAFASGGSTGYDHKKMGITARGAWESVKRHFRELGPRHPGARTSPSSASATCRATCSATGCCCRGTSGWSARVRPPRTSSSTRTPTPRASFEERRRLFELPRLVVGGLRRDADLRGRRRLLAHREVDPAVAAGARGARGRATRR